MRPSHSTLTRSNDTEGGRASATSDCCSPQILLAFLGLNAHRLVADPEDLERLVGHCWWQGQQGRGGGLRPGTPQTQNWQVTAFTATESTARLMGLASSLDLLIASANQRVNRSTRMSYARASSTSGLRLSIGACPSLGESGDVLARSIAPSLLRSPSCLSRRGTRTSGHRSQGSLSGPQRLHVEPPPPSPVEPELEAPGMRSSSTSDVRGARIRSQRLPRKDQCCHPSVPKRKSASHTTQVQSSSKP